MAAIITTVVRSAAPKSRKVATAIAEVMWRWKNASALLSKELFEERSLAFSDDLTAMGFSLKWRINVFNPAIAG